MQHIKIEMGTYSQLHRTLIPHSCFYLAVNQRAPPPGTLNNSFDPAGGPRVLDGRRAELGKLPGILKYAAKEGAISVVLLNASPIGVEVVTSRPRPLNRGRCESTSIGYLCSK